MGKMQMFGSADFVDLKMTKTNHKPNTDPNPKSNPNTRQTLILIYVHNFHLNPFENLQIRTSTFYQWPSLPVLYTQPFH